MYLLKGYHKVVKIWKENGQVVVVCFSRCRDGCSFLIVSRNRNYTTAKPSKCCTCATTGTTIHMLGTET